MGEQLSEIQKADKIRVLIIDDNSIDRAVLKAHLDSMGFRGIQESPSANDGIFKIQTSYDVGNPFDLVITDWRMPGKDGLSVLKFLRSDKTYKNIKIIMLTAVSDKSRVQGALKEGVDDFVLKPIEPEVIHKKIKNLLEGD